VLIDSAAILDWLDQRVGPERALIPAVGEARLRALQRIALACGGIDKLGAANYERLLRPAALRWPEWIARCQIQATGALEALNREDWPEQIDQAQITAGCFLGYVELTSPQMMPPGRYPALDRLWTKLKARDEFITTQVTNYALPSNR
jgi:glutathione S-transferase